MAKKLPPPSVRRAILDGDRETLSYLGKLGAEVKKRKKARKTAILEALRGKQLRADLRSADEMAREAKEDICPVDED